MPKTTKKILCYTAIISILNLSFQPAYAGRSDLSLMSEEMSYTQRISHHFTQKSLHKERMSDPGFEDLQTHATNVPQAGEDVVSWLFLAPLKTMIGAVSLVRQGVRFALENPGKAITMGLLLQARTATSTLSLSSLTPTQGFNISGASANDYSGSSVSSAGDFNGDGLNDVIIGAFFANSGAGKSYVIYGTNSTPSSINLSTLMSLQGFTISGAAGDYSGISVSSAGDFNGDGLYDVIIGANSASGSAGKSYLIYGTNSTPSSINLISLTSLQGFTVSGAAAPDLSGQSVSSAGDFNGDGLNDVIIGAVGANSYTGISYLIYGTKIPPSPISLSSLTPLQGFAIIGEYAGDRSGSSVSSAGDFNGDGLNDVIIGAPEANSGAGKSYLILGTNSTPSSISLSSLTPLQGFAIIGEYAGDGSGGSVSSAGDFNGDGRNDVIIGAPYANGSAGKSYLIYGTKIPLSSISLISLTPLQGFTINGTAANDLSGSSVSSAGDFNGDGRSDVIIGAPAANTGAGKSYLILGTNSTPSLISLISLTPLQGFTINGTVGGDRSGSSVSSAGDFNGDGLNDIIIGAPYANTGAGGSYLIYGASAPSPASPSMMTSAGTGTTIPTNQMTSTNLPPFSSLSITSTALTGVSIQSASSSSSPPQSSSNTGSLRSSSSSTSISTPSSSPPPSPATSGSSTRGVVTSSNNPPSSPPVQSSSGTGTNGISWQTAAAIGGGIGAVVLVGAIGAIVAKKCCFSKGKGSGKSDSTDSDVKLVEENVGTPASSRVVSPFEAKSSGFTEHPTFVGALHRDTYEIWKTLSQEEADLLRPLTSMTVPEISASENANFSLGQGHFGATYAGSNPQTEEIYAIKEVYGREAVDESLREGEIVHSLGDYPHIMPLIDYINFEPKKSQKPRLLQVMPLAYINGAGFKGMLAFSKNGQREKVVSDSFRQMMMGLDYIHSKGVVHLDIKADNTLYMEDGTLRIADFGRAKQVGENDQINDMNNLGDMRKFSPEIIAFIRKCLGENRETVDSFSGKAADVWAAGLYVWELLEDNTDSLFSTKSVPLKTRAANYSYEHFIKLVGKIKSLEGEYSSSLINILRQVLTVDPKRRIGSSRVIELFPSSAMTHNERRAAFEEVISLANEDKSASEEPTATSVYPLADRTQYLPRAEDQPPSSVYVPGSLYGAPSTSNDSPADSTQLPKASDQPPSSVYVPSNLYAKSKL